MIFTYICKKDVPSVLKRAHKSSGHRWAHSRLNRYGKGCPEKPSFTVPDTLKIAQNANPNIYRLITAYRHHGHLQAQIDPLGRNKYLEASKFDPAFYGLNLQDSFSGYEPLTSFRSKESITVANLVDLLKSTYCGNASIELGNIENEEEYTWLSQNWEKMIFSEVDIECKKEILKHLVMSELFDQFVAGKLSTLKRYGNEGAESVMAVFLAILEVAAKDGVETVVMGQGHRGRSNILVGLFELPLERMFRKMKGFPEFPDSVRNTGDVLSHLTSSVQLKFGKKFLHVTTLPNPSHLEAVNPVAMGKTRSKQQTSGDGHYSRDAILPSSKVMCVQTHGDAAFAGQGVVAETFQLSTLPHYDIGGTIHVVINNQIGFTTPPEFGRSSRYSTDIAKSFNMLVIHVNGDDPEMVYKVSQFATDYQRSFRRDVVVDYMCFRRHGHNEMDDPTFTNPGMYKIIHNRRSIPAVYQEKLVMENTISLQEMNDFKANYQIKLNEAYKKSDTYQPEDVPFRNSWSSMQLPPNAIHVWDTGLDASLLKYIGAQSVKLPENFGVHERLLNTHIKSRLKNIEAGNKLDWATAEALALGSLLYQGHHIRFCGQDVGRGTFSHRHMTFVDQNTEEYYVPLNNLTEDQNTFIEVVDSPLSEEAVLGFEYGYSVDNPNNLVVWEAQFGDFFNTAQVIIDTFIASGETKWVLQSGLVLALPHGYDGAGPEHSSCRIERFLQLCDSNMEKHDGDDVNMCVVNPTLPAQYYHLLRKQIIQPYRKPLIIAAPKILLRLSEAVSSIEDMAPGTHFLTVIDDSTVEEKSVSKVVLCSGKYFYSLIAERDRRGIKDTAIIRIEQLCPFPAESLHSILKQYKEAKEYIWCQEEHENMGAWSFVQPRLKSLLGIDLKYIGRRPLAAPAVGVSAWHKQEISELMKKLFG